MRQCREVEDGGVFLDFESAKQYLLSTSDPESYTKIVTNGIITMAHNLQTDFLLGNDQLQ